jgi:hypothetical protein
VLNRFPDTVGKDVATAVVRNLAQSLSIGMESSEPSKLASDKEVKWTMEVMFPVYNYSLIRMIVFGSVIR